MTLISKQLDGEAPVGGQLVQGKDGSGNAQDLLSDTDGHLQVDVLSGGGGGTQLQDGDAVNAANTGGMVLGTDGSNYQVLATDSSGNLQVDILTGGGGTEYTEDEATANPIVGGAVVMERDDALSTVTPAEGDWIALRGSAEGALWTQDFNSDAILADTTTIAGAVSGSEMQVDIVSDGAGLATAANQTTVIGHVDGIETLLTSIDSDTSTVAGAVAGTEMQVDVVAALPAGTNAIGKLAANSGVDIGDVDVTSQVPGTGATNLGKAQDTAVGATDTGVAMLAQRDDEQAAVTPADGDYVVPRTDKFGNLKTTQLPDATSEVKYGVINVASSGDNTLQAAAGAGVKIRVLSMAYTCGGTVNVRIESGAGGTALTGIQEWIAQTGMVLPYNPAGWFETADNTLLNMELSAAVNVDGCFTYVEV